MTGGPQQVDDHLALGHGQIDYRAVLHKLEEMGYDGPVILELTSQKDLEESLNSLSTFL
jgi:sugar phosphate isomerase/epimerase